MTLSRDDLLATLSDTLESDERIEAMWLQGADGLGAVDEFSDIDLCLSVRPGCCAEITDVVRRALALLGPLDIDVARESRPTVSRAYLHVAGTPPYLVVDLNVYVGRGRGYFRDDPLERPMVIFNKVGLDLFVDQPTRAEFAADATRLEVLRGTVALHAFVTKYIQRNEFVEEMAYYHAWIVAPLMEALRMVHTPLHTDWFIVHASRTFPPAMVSRLEELWAVGSLGELRSKLASAVAWFEEVYVEAKGAVESRCVPPG